MVSLIFVSTLETMLEIKCMTSVISFSCQTEFRLVVVIVKGWSLGVRGREMGSDC